MIKKNSYLEFKSYRVVNHILCIRGIILCFHLIVLKQFCWQNFREILLPMLNVSNQEFNIQVFGMNLPLPE